MSLDSYIEYTNKVQHQEQLDNSAQENALQFYREHQSLCDESYKYYKEFDFKTNEGKTAVTDEGKRIEYVKDIVTDVNEFVRLLRKTKIVVITATKLEQAIYHHWLYDYINTGKKTRNAIERYYVESTTYTVYSHDDCSIIQTIPADKGANLTQMLMEKISAVLVPDYLVMLGICYGMQLDTQKIGNVVIAKQVIPIRINFIEDNKSGGEVYYHVDDSLLPAHPIPTFINGIEEVLRLQHFPRKKISQTVNVFISPSFGNVVSADNLMSSHKVKWAILSHYEGTKNKPLGGEMEGIGLIHATIVQDGRLGKWLLIKSICDWGEGKNSLSEDEKENDRIKDSLQAYAMINTCSTFEFLLQYLK